MKKRGTLQEMHGPGYIKLFGSNLLCSNIGPNILVT